MNSQGLVFKISGPPPRRSSLNICSQEPRDGTRGMKKIKKEKILIKKRRDGQKYEGKAKWRNIRAKQASSKRI